MAKQLSPGQQFKEAVQQESPLQVVGAINAYSAILARDQGYKALYLSGAGVANASLGLPDLGISTCADVCIDIERITNAVALPLLVDMDTGWGSYFNIQRAIRQIEKAGAAAVHIEDQVQAKRCGHRPNKAIVTVEEMCDRIKACVDARRDDDFVIMARTDALANEGIDGTLERIAAYKDAGADMLFPEAITEIEDYKTICSSTKLPVLANITEFGKTPLFRTDILAEAGVAIALYPLSAFRAMANAALGVYQGIRQSGGQSDLINTMQNREQLYHFLDYHDFEQTLDKLQEEEL